MIYDFTSIMDRRGKDALAVDAIGGYAWGFAPQKAKPGFEEIPMWVADMNFATAPSIIEAIQKRIAHPAFGYFAASDEYYQSIIDWQVRQHAYQGLTKDVIGYENGVHGCVATSIQLFTEPGDAILVHSPTYVGFLGDIKESGRRTVYSPLKRDDQGIWRMDFEDMDKKLRDNDIHLAIFCSPHNPTGRVWERWELEKAMEVYQKNDCIVVSDEIWSDIIFSDYQHIPTAMVSEDARQRTIGIYAPSKTFNLAGLIGSYHIIFNPLLRKKIEKYSAKTHYNEMNVLSMHALIGAYTEVGEDWKNQLCQVLEKNCRYAVDTINEKFEGCLAAMPQGTYMIFMNVKDYCQRTGKTLDQVLKAGWDVGVAYQDGRMFADNWSIRINCALPFSRVQEAFDRLDKYVFND